MWGAGGGPGGRCVNGEPGTAAGTTRSCPPLDLALVSVPARLSALLVPEDLTALGKDMVVSAASVTLRAWTQGEKCPTQPQDTQSQSPWQRAGRLGSCRRWPAVLAPRMGKAHRKREDATPISMRYTAFCRMNIQHLCFLFV